MQANLTESQTNKIANRIYANIQRDWWNYIDEVFGNDYDVELNDEDFTNIAKSLAKLLQT